jgi:hypothetical protein
LSLRFALPLLVASMAIGISRLGTPAAQCLDRNQTRVCGAQT